jgi:dipeptidyl aminopeptidase/acylaminoacyl peptidase
VNHALSDERSLATRAWLAVAAPVHADVAADGRRVVVTSVRVPAGGTDEITTLCLVDVDTGVATAVAGARAGDAMAVWSPTGDRLAFLTERTGTTQIAVVDVDVDVDIDEGNEGNVRVVTHMRTGVVGAVTWSPDGQRLAFTAPRSRVIDRTLPYRVARPVPWADGIGPLDDPPQVWTVELALGVCKQLTNDEWRWSMPRWSPDGRTIAARASHDPSGQRRGMHLRLVTLDGNWTAPALPGGFAVVPAWGASGSLAVLVAQPEGRTIGSRGQLHVVDGDDVRDLTAEVSFGVGGDVYGDSPAVLGDAHHAALLTGGDNAYVRVHDRGRMGIARVSLRDTAEWRVVVSGDRCVSPVAADSPSST